MVLKPLLKPVAIEESLAWLQGHTAKAEIGNYPPGESDWYANAHHCEALLENHCC